MLNKKTSTCRQAQMYGKLIPLCLRSSASGSESPAIPHITHQVRDQTHQCYRSALGGFLAGWLSKLGHRCHHPVRSPDTSPACLQDECPFRFSLCSCRTEKQRFIYSPMRKSSSCPTQETLLELPSKIATWILTLPHSHVIPKHSKAIISGLNSILEVATVQHRVKRMDIFKWAL